MAQISFPCGLTTPRSQAGAHVESQAPSVGNVACSVTDKTMLLFRVESRCVVLCCHSWMAGA